MRCRGLIALLIWGQSVVAADLGTWGDQLKATLFRPFGPGRGRFSVMREGLCGFGSALDRGFPSGCI